MSCREEMKAAILSAIEQKFGAIDDMGSYCRETGEWMSTQRIFEVVCETIDALDWYFVD